MTHLAMEKPPRFFPEYFREMKTRFQQEEFGVYSFKRLLFCA
jgi:hypothetical protein